MKSSNVPPTASPEGGLAQLPLVFALQHFCLHDGPGTRSIVFFKGCPLRCSWCQNPESWRREVELGHKANVCISCEQCVQICPTSAMRRPGDWEPDACTSCMKCVDVCPAGAMVRFGEARSVEMLHAELRKEYALYRRSGGGVTFSGGEATLFADFAGKLAAELRQDGIHVTVETCGLFNLEDVELRTKVRRLLAHTDLLLFDLKLFSDEAHRLHCGAGNVRIKDNLVALARERREGSPLALWPRLPVIPGITDTPANLAGWANFLLELNLTHISLVPYHELGSGKRRWLKGIPLAPRLPILSEHSLEQTRQYLRDRGITPYAPGEENWQAA